MDLVCVALGVFAVAGAVAAIWLALSLRDARLAIQAWTLQSERAASQLAEEQARRRAIVKTLGRARLEAERDREISREQAESLLKEGEAWRDPDG